VDFTGKSKKDNHSSYFTRKISNNKEKTDSPLHSFSNRTKTKLGQQRGNL